MPAAIINRRLPMYLEDFRRSCETLQRFPKIVRNLPKITEDRTKISEDHRTSPMTSDNLRISPKIIQRSPDVFEAFPSFGRSRAVASAYLSSQWSLKKFLRAYLFQTALVIIVITYTNTNVQWPTSALCIPNDTPKL